MKTSEITVICNIKKLQRYMVSIKLWELEDLKKQGVISDYNTGVFFLVNDDYYNSETGILFTAKHYFI